MPAPKGHPLWGNPLKPKKLTPEQLWDGACEYFQWCDDNPLSKQDFIRGGDSAGQLIDVSLPRAYSIERLCIYLNISRETFDRYSKDAGYETYYDICHAIRDIINTNHFEGGMAGNFNANIVTRKLGLQEKIQSQQVISITSMNPEEEAEIKKAFEDAKKDENIPG